MLATQRSKPDDQANETDMNCKAHHRHPAKSLARQTTVSIAVPNSA